jgi:hypothetical protein
MKITAFAYTVFAAVIGFACGSLHSCMERDTKVIVTPEEFPAREFKVDALPFPSEYVDEDQSHTRVDL